MDDVAAVQSYVKKSEVTAQYYGAGAALKNSVTGREERGAVKGASATHESMLAAAASAARTLQLGAADSLLSTAPLHTQSGFAAGVLAPALAGAKLVLPSRSFNAEEALSAATLQRATHVLVGSPEEAAALDAALAKGGGKYNLSSVRGGAVVAGGAATLRGVALKPLA
jgi:acyl-CoA synthetase (AMP-forming)/AMP-acid ligase II